MRCGLQDSADLTVFNLLDIMMFFLTVPHWVVYTLVLLLHVCSLILIDIDIDIDMSQGASHLRSPSQNRGRELCVPNDAPEHCRMSSNMYANM